MEQAYLVAFNRTRGKAIATKVLKAEDYASRSQGLLGRQSLDQTEGLWIVPCPMIHTVGMKFAIDAVFLNKKLQVVRVIANLKPWRMSPWVWRAHSVLELAAGVSLGTVAPGDQLEFVQS